MSLAEKRLSLSLPPVKVGRGGNHGRSNQKGTFLGIFFPCMMCERWAAVPSLHRSQHRRATPAEHSGDRPLSAAPVRVLAEAVEGPEAGARAEMVVATTVVEPFLTPQNTTPFTNLWGGVRVAGAGARIVVVQTDSTCARAEGVSVWRNRWETRDLSDLNQLIL